MNLLVSLLVLLATFFIGCVYSQQCLYYIKNLAQKDKCLASRIDLKRQYSAKLSKVNFIKTISKSRCNGTAFACGKTMSWVTEVFEGLDFQYDESKYDNYVDGSKIGYSFLTGDDLRSLFNNNKNKRYLIVYQLRFTGNEDHVSLNKFEFKLIF